MTGTTMGVVGVVGAVLVAAGLVVGIVALLALHLLPTGLSPVRNAVSQYGISRYRAGYRVQTVGYAVAGVGAAIGIAALPVTGTLPVVLCAVFAATRAAIGWFPMDAPGAPPTRTGAHHGLLATGAFVSVAAAAAALSRVLGRDRVDAGMATLSGVLAAVMLALLVAMMVDRRAGTGRFGLIERAFYLTMTAWLVAVGVLLAVAGR